MMGNNNNDLPLATAQIDQQHQKDAEQKIHQLSLSMI